MEFRYDKKKPILNEIVESIQLNNPLDECKKPWAITTLGILKNQLRCLDKDYHIAGQHVILRLNDGGTVCYHYYSSPLTSSTEVFKNDSKINNNVKSPKNLLFILEGFGGTPQNKHYPLISSIVDNENWHLVSFHRRGIHCPLTTFAQYQSGCDTDIITVLKFLHQQHPLTSIYILGISAGGVIGLRCLGKYNSSLPFVKGICTISSAIHSAMFSDINPQMAYGMLKIPKSQLEDYANQYANDYKKFTLKDRAIYQELQDIGTSNERYDDNNDNNNDNDNITTDYKYKQDHEDCQHGKQHYDKWGQSRNIIRKYLETEAKLCSLPNNSNYNCEYLQENWIHGITQPCLIINAKDDYISKEPQKFAGLIDKIPQGIYLVTNQGGHCGYPCTIPGSNLDWAECTMMLFFNHIVKSLATSKS